VDSLYVRLKFGIPKSEFQELFGFVNGGELLAQDAVEVVHSTRVVRAGLTGPVQVSDSTVRIANRHKFLEWAKACGRYDDLALDNLEYLICQEIMNEVVQ